MNPAKIAFHKTSIAPPVKKYLADACSHHNSLFRGKYNQLCSQYIKSKFGCEEVVLTSSCTDALTMATLILGLGQDDEVVIPSYTFTSVANVFANRGIAIKMADSQADHPNMDPESFLRLIGPRTRAVVFMSYGGQSKGIEQIVKIAAAHNIVVIEDAAHSFGSRHQNKLIGSFGDFAAFSFHDTKAVSCGQGGLLMVNQPGWTNRIKCVRDHGTNRWQVQEGICNEYNWISLGGEFNLPELSAAVLFGQLESEDDHKAVRKNLWTYYYERLLPLSGERFELPQFHDQGSNFYIFYIVLKSHERRTALIAHLAEQGIDIAIHYTGLHLSLFSKLNFTEVALPNADRYAQCLVRLPMYSQLTIQDLERICLSIENFYTIAYDAPLV